MGLREIAEADMSSFLSDDTNGFGYTISLTNPSEETKLFVGFSNDIYQAIDVDTGTIVSGRSASVALSISELASAGFSLPVGIANTAGKPWLVTFDDINGTSHKFKIASTEPDRSIGLIICHLESYKNG